MVKRQSPKLKMLVRFLQPLPINKILRVSDNMVSSYLKAHPAYQYARDVVEGKLTAGKYVKRLAANSFLTFTILIVNFYR